MKTLLTTLAILVFFLPVLPGTGQSISRKVLFLGNSYTYVNNLPQILAALAANTGDELIYDGNLIGGFTLQDHFGNQTSKNKILSNDWDYIVLQEQSQVPAFEVPFAFMDGFSNLKAYIDQHKPCAQLTSFMTWGHENGDVENCPVFPAVCTYDGMQNLLSSRYLTISEMYESEVTPVGTVWKYLRENHPSIPLYQADGSHPTLAGSYLAACCFYTSIFRKDPSLITANYGLDIATAQTIRNATKSIVYNQMTNWYIGKYLPVSRFTYSIGTGFNEVLLNNTNQTVYQDSLVWDFGDGSVARTNNPIHSYSSDGTYTIRLTSYKCFLGQILQSVAEKTVTFCPSTHTIYPNLILCPNTTDTIWTQEAENYQWLNHQGEAIPNGNQQFYVASPGNYAVLTTLNGCTEQSPQILVDEWLDNPDCLVSQIKPKEGMEVKMDPNPVEDVLYIQSPVKIQEIWVYNLLGKKMRVEQSAFHVLDFSEFPSGMYTVVISFENKKTFIQKLVKK